MDPRDKALQSTSPAVMVPKFAPVEPAAGPGERILIARNGVFREIRRSWGTFVRKVGTVNIPLPYGETKESTNLLIQRLPRNLIHQFIEASQSNCDVEIGGSILWNETSCEFRLVFHRSLSSSGSHLEYERAQQKPGEHLIVDCHSHAHFPASFSSTDDVDDKWEVKIALVVGDCQTKNPSIATRLCLRGHFENFELQLT